MKIFPLDKEFREQALDPEISCIVQAPAGSGKTELLTQRYLRLLSLVQNPEEILAITFTRKAAAEMRNRIISSLQKAESEPKPENEPHLAMTWELASKALEKNHESGWGILENPSRLKIRTIDSFCLYLTGRMPLLSGMGVTPEVANDPDELYEEAARNTLLQLKSGTKWYKDLSTVLLHLDNDWNRTMNFIMDMLKLREHWLRLVGDISADSELKFSLEKNLSFEVQRRLKRLRKAFTDNLNQHQLQLIFESARYASDYLLKNNKDSKVTTLDKLSSLPGSAPEDLDLWLGLKDLLMTTKNEFRKKVNKSSGFPPDSDFKSPEQKKFAKKIKTDFHSLLENLKDEEVLKQSLAEIADLPETFYSEESWQVLSALVRILKMAAAQLHLAMQKHKKVDYSEISRAALNALGTPDSPSDLLMRLDYQIKHILFDEFQDTSITQQQMLTMLTSGWEKGDGRTLFVVGDPMQSIYGFRDADVGVFINTRQSGIGDVQLKPLNLSVNFRSQKGIVDWVNQIFPNVFQDVEDYVSGSVIYSTMHSSSSKSGQVRIHPFIDPGPADEANEVVKIIEERTSEHPDDSIAVLVRTRTHLQEILKKLQQSRIRYQAVEIEPLKEKQIVMDLLSLTRALLLPHDTLSWLSILRAPWTGLDLKDLTIISEFSDDMPFPQKISNPEQIKGLSSQGLNRLKKFSRIIVPAWENRQRRPLFRLVEGIWMALGGPACARNRQEIKNAQSYLEHLEKFQQNNTIENLPAFEKSLQTLFSKADPEADSLLQVMTIHKAKGLEFDTVIIPGLEKPPRPSDKLLLQFMETPSENHEQLSRLYLAPIAKIGDNHHPTYKFIEKLKNEKEKNEIGRLLYVAVTRAKKRLHLLASAQSSQQENCQTPFKSPKKNSLIEAMWDQVVAEFESCDQVQANIPNDQEKPLEIKNNILVRLDSSWTLPELKGCDLLIPEQDETTDFEEPVTYHWAGDTIRHIGTKVHDLLKTIAQDGLDKWSSEKLNATSQKIRNDLSSMGVSLRDLSFASAKVIDAVTNTINDPQGRWILDRHSAEACEYALSALIDGQITNVVIDRTFIDENKVRWIIDYKTSTHAGGSLEEFIDREVDRYQGQLRRYMQIISLMDQRKVKAGLYFPLLKIWRNIE
ncbi:MAG: UvrD-helicase domain-containing protein [Desulfonatronovibrio sp.]